MQFLRTVNTVVAELAQQRTAEVLVLAFKKIDDRIAELQYRVDEAVRAKKLFNHRVHEHSEAKRTGCTCELCEIYKEIKALASCRANATYPFQYDLSADNRPYVYCIDRRLFRLHNMRRQLMGLPVKEWKPDGHKWKHTSTAEAEKKCYLATSPVLCG